MTKGNSDMRISNRSQVIRKISACDVVLFGAGYRAHQFYNSYKNVLNIIFCISNNVKERKCSFDDGRQLKVEKPSDDTNETRPILGSSFIKASAVVVFPAPVSPTRPNVSPLSITKSMPFTA